MPIYSTHPEYDQYAPQWEMCEDFYEGAVAVKGKKDTYLPRLEEQSEASYDSYLMRTSFFGAVGRTVDGMAGSVMREAPAIKLPPELSYVVKDATGKGQTLSEVLLLLLKGVLTSNRMGLLVDVSRAGGDPVIVPYEGDCIVNWAEDRSLVVLREQLYVSDPKDKYARVEITQYRELTLIGGVYGVNLWREDPDKPSRPGQRANWVIVDSFVPLQRGKPLDYIPFTFISDMGTDPCVSKPLLYDLVQENLSHYLKSADYCHGLHFTGLPTFFVTGVTPDPKIKIRVGAEVALMLPNPNARAGYAEFNGQGLDGLREALKEHEGKMAALGARLIEQNRRGQVQTAESARIQQSGEVAVLASIINSVEEGVLKALYTMADWVFADRDAINLKINRDLVEARVDANTLIALLQAVQAGRISHQTYYENIKDAGYTEPGRTFEAEVDAIKTQFNATPLDQTAAKKPLQVGTGNNIPGSAD